MTHSADERAAMIAVIESARYLTAEAMADDLLAKGFGWTRGGAEAGLREAGQALRRRFGPYACTHECQCGDCEAVSEWDAALARPSAPETRAWAVLGADGKIAEFSAYLMTFSDQQDAIDHALPDQGERTVPVTIRIGEGLPREVDG